MGSVISTESLNTLEESKKTVERNKQKEKTKKLRFEEKVHEYLKENLSIEVNLDANEFWGETHIISHASLYLKNPVTGRDEIFSECKSTISVVAD